jgi:hypothetical protein
MGAMSESKTEETVAVPRLLVAYASGILIGSGCEPEDYEPECEGCQMRLKGEELKRLLDE